MSDQPRDENSDETTKAYKVGYKKPPCHTRFRKGKSGNPSGRPKGSPNAKTAYRRALSEQVVGNAGGRRVTMSSIDAFYKKLVAAALTGGVRDRQLLLKEIQRMEEQFFGARPAGQPAPPFIDHRKILREKLLARRERLLANDDADSGS